MSAANTQKMITKAPKAVASKSKAKPTEATVKPNTQKSGKTKAKANKNVKPKTVDSIALRESETLSDFRTASGQTAGVKEVVVTFDDFFDTTGGWTSVCYAPTTLPVYFSGSSVRFLRATFDVLEQAANNDNATNNVMVLTGVRVTGGTTTVIPTLGASQQTMIVPSNVPVWRRVLDANLDALTHQGYTLSQGSGQTVEVGRLALVNPDDGNMATSTPKLQVRASVRYACSIPVQSTATAMISVPGAVLDPPTGSAFVTTVFAKVTSLQNKI